MKKFIVTSLMVVFAIGIFAAVGAFAADDQGAKAIVDGANQMMDGNQKITMIMEKKGIKDPELTTAQRQMAEGYDLVLKGHQMMADQTAENRQSLPFYWRPNPK